MSGNMAKKKPRKLIVYSDMDGVLANFRKGVGRDDYDFDPPEMFVKGFFRNLEPMAGAKEAIDELLKMDHIKLYILSKPTTKNLHCATEKYEWINEHFPKLLKRMFLACEKGHLNGDFLIDDDANRWRKVFRGHFIHFDEFNSAQEWVKVVEFFKNLRPVINNG
jgi:5'(3')-deoxyribonucleotidase